MFWRWLSVQSIIASTLHPLVLGYIPAFPANSTGSASLIDVHDDSSLELTWHPNNQYGSTISYQQHGNMSSGISKVCAPYFTGTSCLVLIAVAMIYRGLLSI